jgi:uncharacterized membrane protein (UPF0182 family)
VQVSNFVRRASLALRFGSWDLMVSNQLTSSSRVLYQRDVSERVHTAAPFLRFDADPYPVILDGRIIWVVDAYTTTSSYPYAQALRPRSLTPGSGLDTEFNYVRNSVKATVDAYDGTVTFYVWDEEDPIIRAWAKAFPDLFTDRSEVPAALAAHFRYPEDMFRAQTEAFAAYHVTDPAEFFRGQSLWDIAAQPERAAIGAGVTTTTAQSSGNDGGRNTTLSGTSNPIVPLYLMLQLPGEDQAEFVLSRPFVPRQREGVLSAFMVARSDPEHYGELVLYETPEGDPPSPAIAANSIEADTEISSRFSLLERGGSELRRGSVQLLPVGDSIVFLRPIFVQGQESSRPLFRFVAMTDGRNSVLASSVDCALEALDLIPVNAARNCETSVSGTEGEEPPEEEPPEEEPPGEGALTVQELLDRAAQEFAAAEEARRSDADDWFAQYQQHIAEAQRLVEEAQRRAAGDGSPTTTTTVAGEGA